MTFTWPTLFLSFSFSLEDKIDSNLWREEEEDEEEEGKEKSQLNRGEYWMALISINKIDLRKPKTFNSINS